MNETNSSQLLCVLVSRKDLLVRLVPGLPLTQYYSFEGEIDTAKSTLISCLNQDSTFSDAHLLMAQVRTALLYMLLSPLLSNHFQRLTTFLFFFSQIHLQQNNYKLAEQSLEVGLSYNFEVSWNVN